MDIDDFDFDDDDEDVCPACQSHYENCSCDDEYEEEKEMDTVPVFQWPNGPMLICHGAGCCGIKHIYGLGGYPTYEAPSLDEVSAIRPHESRTYTNGNGQRVYHLAAPAETYLKRVSRYMDFLRETRPKGVVEIVLSSHQVSAWEKSLIKLGFTLSVKAVNSNSSDKISIYHCAYGQPAPKKPAKENNSAFPSPLR